MFVLNYTFVNWSINFVSKCRHIDLVVKIGFKSGFDPIPFESGSATLYVSRCVFFFKYKLVQVSFYENGL